MVTIKEIEEAVSNLPPEKLAQFRVWFEEFDAKLWDSQFEKDVKAGKFDTIANKALADFKEGKFTEL